MFDSINHMTLKLLLHVNRVFVLKNAYIQEIDQLQQ